MELHTCMLDRLYQDSVILHNRYILLLLCLHLHTNKIKNLIEIPSNFRMQAIDIDIVMY